jgi:hypothetical protein
MRDFAGNTLLFQDFMRGLFMSETTKRLDLQFGSFACSIQGFDDPVQPVQQVLQALQNMLEETPEIGSTGFIFDAETIEQLIGEVVRRADLDENNIEIVPGLIVIQHGDGGAAAHDTDLEAGDQEAGDQEDNNEAWAQPFVAGAGDVTDDMIEAEAGEAREDVAEAGSDAEPDAGTGFVNIFAPGGYAAEAHDEGGADEVDTGSGPSETGGEDTPEPDEEELTGDGDPFAARLQQVASEASDTTETDPFAADEDVAEDGPTRDIFAEPDDSTDDNIFADPMAANTGTEPDEGADEGEAPVNFFSATDSSEEATGPDNSEDDLVLESGDDELDRGEALFGLSDDQPEAEEIDEGYTAAGLAQTAGAETVAEMMVTAAAWMVLIQGQTTFSRRDVVDVFQTIPGEHSKTLEARIKGFGKAVRNEQLIMVEDGVFGLSRTELERFQGLL